MAMRVVRQKVRADGTPETEKDLLNWLAQVQSDPELALDLQNGPCFAVWSRPSQNPDPPWIDWFKGNLFTNELELL